MTSVVEDMPEQVASAHQAKVTAGGDLPEGNSQLLRKSHNNGGGTSGIELDASTTESEGNQNQVLAAVEQLKVHIADSAQEEGMNHQEKPIESTPEIPTEATVNHIHEAAQVSQNSLGNNLEVSTLNIPTEDADNQMDEAAQITQNTSGDNLMQEPGGDGVEGSGPIIAAEWTIPGLGGNANFNDVQAEIFGGDLSDLSDVSQPGPENIEDTVELTEQDKQQLSLWSIRGICLREMPIRKSFGLNAVKDSFSKDGPTLPLGRLFDHPLPPLKLVRTLKARALGEMRYENRSVLTGDITARLPLKVIGAWEVIHGAIEAKLLWNSETNGLQWAKAHLSESEIDTLAELTAAVPWDGKIDALYGKLPISVLSKLLSDSKLNDETVDTMLSAMIVRMREQGVPQKGVWGVAHISFAQCLQQLQVGYRKGYPTNANPVLMHTGNMLEQRDEVSVYGVANSQDAHWAAFCIAKTFSKIVVTWGDSLNWPVPHKFHEGLTTWLAHHCPNIIVEVDTTTMKHGVQTDDISCGVVAINTLKHHFFNKKLWVPERRHSLRFESFVDVIECYLVSPMRTPIQHSFVLIQ